MQSLKFQRTETNAKMPARRGVRLDLFACNHDGRTVVVPARGAATVQIGLAVDLPKGFVLKLYSYHRQGGQGLRLANGTGVVYDDCLEPINVRLQNDSDEPIEVPHGTKVCQALPEKALEFEIVEVEAPAIKPAPAAAAAPAAAPAAKKGAKADKAKAEAPAAPATEPAPAPADDAAEQPAEPAAQ